MRLYRARQSDCVLISLFSGRLVYAEENDEAEVALAAEGKRRSAELGDV
jgi:hypothetical protein